MAAPALACIKILDKEALNSNRGLKEEMFVLFNPTEYAISKGAQIAEIGIPGLDNPLLQFVRGQNTKLTLELFFDTTDSGMGEDARDVRELTAPFFELVRIQPETHAPPRIQFMWGSPGKPFDKANDFKAIVESVNQKFTLFAPNGNPLRATLSLTLREYKSIQEQVEELKLNSPDHTKRRMVKRGETLSQIAWEEYRDPQMWRVIAEANRLTNLRDLTPGTELELPAIEPGSDFGGR
ncbi:MAG: peptidoglycan-binding protein [Anaerolineae bacterium]|nr:peptidoglycan-binding protein [Chloroflexota bacterium]MBN8637085.1 peptidoglycan-binding protein [Anaerolineae bacterium]